METPDIQLRFFKKNLDGIRQNLAHLNEFVFPELLYGNDVAEYVDGILSCCDSLSAEESARVVSNLHHLLNFLGARTSESYVMVEIATDPSCTPRKVLEKICHHPKLGNAPSILSETLFWELKHAQEQ